MIVYWQVINKACIMEHTNVEKLPMHVARYLIVSYSHSLEGYHNQIYLRCWLILFIFKFLYFFSKIKKKKSLTV